MAVKDPNVPLSRPYVDAYWELVRRCLTDFFPNHQMKQWCYKRKLKVYPTHVKMFSIMEIP